MHAHQLVFVCLCPNGHLAVFDKSVPASTFFRNLCCRRWEAIVYKPTIFIPHVYNNKRILNNESIPGLSLLQYLKSNNHIQGIGYTASRRSRAHSKFDCYWLRHVQENYYRFLHLTHSDAVQKSVVITHNWLMNCIYLYWMHSNELSHLFVFHTTQSR